MSTTAPSPTPTGTDNVLELNGISKSFGAVNALDDVTIHIRPNEVIGLIGENGAGKSTLLKILAGLHQHDTGQFLLHGEERRFRDPAEAAALGIGVVHQEQSLLTNLSVAENIYMGSGNTGVKSDGVVGPGLYRWGKLNAEAEAALRAVGSTAAADAIVDQLSFADRQMVEIAKALKVADVASGQPLLILDEPTSVLEPKETEVLEREIARLKTVGSVVFVSHRLQEVLRVSDRIYVLRHGKVVAERDAATVVEDELFELMTGRHAQEPRDRLPTGALSMQPALDVQKLSRRGHFRDIDLQIQPGQVCALVGTVGSGREEFSRALFGAEPFDRGRFVLDGHSYTRIGIRKAIRRGIGYLPSERRVEGMTAGMSLAENLTLTHPAGTQWGPFILTGPRRARTEEWIKRVDLRPDNPDADIAQLSGGNQQKLVLGKWLLADNLRLLILDHPLRGLDPGAKEAVAGLVREACAAGVAVLLLADTLEEALGNGDQIVVMNDGVITGRFDLNVETPTMAQIVERMV